MFKFKNSSVHSSQNNNIFSLSILCTCGRTKNIQVKKACICLISVLMWMDNVRVETDQCSQTSSKQWLETSLLDRSYHYCHCYQQKQQNKVTTILYQPQVRSPSALAEEPFCKTHVKLFLFCVFCLTVHLIAEALLSFGLHISKKVLTNFHVIIWVSVLF